jgi:acetyl-CoA C-acetyltransferase
MAGDVSDVVVVGYGRTPFARFSARLSGVGLPALGAALVSRVLARTEVAPDSVDEVVFGVNFPGGDRSIARQVALLAEIPHDRTAITVDRACCSSLTATTLVSRSLRLGDAAVGVAGGCENLSAVPYTLPGLRFGERLGEVRLDDPLVISCPLTGERRAVQAGIEAVAHGIDRAEQDEWALRSHQLQQAALAREHFTPELVPLVVEDRDGHQVAFELDECARPDVDPAQLAALPTVYGSPTITAGNAPNLSTGASALVLASAEEAAERGLEPLARFRSFAQLSGDPQRIASVPAHAARLALARAGVGLDDVHVIEINEAFAAVPLVSTLVLADGDATQAAMLRERTNLAGGALAVGHPTGATAARLVMTLISHLRQRGGGLGLVTICGGIGEAEACVVEV